MAVETSPSTPSLPPLGCNLKPMGAQQYIPTNEMSEVYIQDGNNMPMSNVTYVSAQPTTYFACPPVQLARHTSLPVSMMRTTTPVHYVAQPPQPEMSMPPTLGRQRSLGFIMHQQAPMQNYGVQVPRLVTYPSVMHMAPQMQHAVMTSQPMQEEEPQHMPMMKHEQHNGNAPGVEPIAFNGRASEARMSLGEIDSLALAVLSDPSDEAKRDDSLSYNAGRYSAKYSNASSAGCAQDLQKALESLDKLMPEEDGAPRFSFPSARGSLPILISPTLRNNNGMSPSNGMQMMMMDSMQRDMAKTSPKPIAFCKVAGCGRRVRSKGFCKTHGGGRKCSIEGCKKSSQNGEFCIGHGGGKKCKQEGCAKAAQSHGLCKAHGGGARCKYPNCNKSSQGGGLCRAHGGGKRCQAAGCPKGAQRGNFCATHGGFRNCKIEGCVRTDRGGGFCEVHRRGRLCKVEGCKKLARNQGMCTMHIREDRQDVPEGMQLVNPVA